MGVPVISPDNEMTKTWMLATASINPQTGELHLCRLDRVHVEINSDKQTSFAWINGELHELPLGEDDARPGLMVLDRVLLDSEGFWGIYPNYLDGGDR